MPIAKAVGGGGFRSALAIEPSWALRPVARTSALAVPLTTELPMKTRLGGKRGLARGRAGRRRCVLFGRVGLAGEERFIDIEIARFDQPAIGGHEIAGREKNDVAGHDLRRGNVDRLSIAKRFGGKRDLLAQPLGGVLGLALLRHVENYGHQHNGGDDDEARNVPGERRYGRREEQNQDQRIAEPLDKVGQQAPAAGRVDPVRPNRLEDGGGVGRAEAVGG